MSEETIGPGPSAELPKETTPLTAAHLLDPRRAGREFPLDGFLERHRFAPGLTIGVWLIAAFIAMQVIALVVFLVGLLWVGGDMQALGALTPSEMMGEYGREFLWANTVGQFLGLLLLGYLVARLHSSKPGRFLRLSAPDPGLLGLSAIGLIALMPIVQWLGTLMQGLPWPDWVIELEQFQVDLIEQILTNDFGLFFTLFAMAITPALCEELFFRGYIQTQAERVFRGWIGAIIFTGVIFGLYHLRLTQALPLSVLGTYLAYVVWRSNSLVPGVLVHFMNNGIAIGLAAFISSSDSVTLEEVEAMDIPVWVLLPAAIIFSMVVKTMHARGAGLAHNPGGNHG